MITEYLFVLAGLLVITGLLAATEYFFDGLKWLVKKLVAAMESKKLRRESKKITKRKKANSNRTSD